MMRQSSLSGFERYTKKTRKERFLEKMDRIIPWEELTQALKPCYPGPVGRGRRPKKGNQWYFRMKLHLGVDSKMQLVYSAVATAANIHDSQVLNDLLHGDETRVWGGSAYAG